MSQFQWAIIRRTLFVLTLAWLFGAVIWTTIPVPEIVATFGLIVFMAAYVYTLTKWKLPKTPFSNNIAHDSHPSNIALKEVFVSAFLALPVLLALARLSYQVT